MGEAVNAFGGKVDMETLEAHGKEVKKFEQKMMDKYDSFEEKKKFSEMVRGLMQENCL